MSIQQTIIIADDHPITLNGVKTYVENLNYKVIGIYDNGISAYDNIITLLPNICILDLNMPGMNGLEVLEKIRKTELDLKVIIYTMYHEKSLFEKAEKLGVNGYLLKDFALEELSICLKELAFKKTWFSPKLNISLAFNNTDETDEKILSLSAAEKKIISMIARELSTKDIATSLFISEKTVEHHRSNIIKKLQLPNTKNALLIWAIENKKIFKNNLS